MNDQARQMKSTGGSTARPYSMTRVVTWGDCDPAGIIYTPNVLDLAMQALEAWSREVLGIPWVTLNRDMHLGAPTVRAEIDFLAAPAPDDAVITSLKIRKIGRCSVTYEMTGRDGQGKDYYRAVLVACFIARPSFEATPIPDAIRERMLAYQRECGDA